MDRLSLPLDVSLVQGGFANKAGARMNPWSFFLFSSVCFIALTGNDEGPKAAGRGEGLALFFQQWCMASCCFCWIFLVCKRFLVFRAAQQKGTRPKTNLFSILSFLISHLMMTRKRKLNPNNFNCFPLTFPCWRAHIKMPRSNILLNALFFNYFFFFLWQRQRPSLLCL